MKKRKTTFEVLDEDLWAWIQYNAKVLKYETTSKYMFALFKAAKTCSEDQG